MKTNTRSAAFLPVLLLALFISLALPGQGAARMVFEFETGSAFTSYNDVRIPGNSGTLFSIQDDLNPNASLFFRLRATWEINSDHALSVLIAPLRFDASGIAPKAIDFYGTTFPMGDMLDAKYRFDSYRLTYRYTLVDQPSFQVKLGLTAKIRDAAITIKGSTDEVERANTGFVPLINFSLQWFLGGGISLLLDGDALAAPQGRAEDILLGVQYDLDGKYYFRAGWRVVEGGSDGDNVYNFTWVNYISLAAGIRL
jgi:hypothetical protein